MDGQIRNTGSLHETSSYITIIGLFNKIIDERSLKVKFGICSTILTQIQNPKVQENHKYKTKIGMRDVGWMMRGVD
jgi:hypothetical protein